MGVVVGTGAGVVVGGETDGVPGVVVGAGEGVVLVGACTLDVVAGTVAVAFTPGRVDVVVDGDDSAAAAAAAAVAVPVVAWPGGDPVATGDDVVPSGPAEDAGNVLSLS